MEISYKIYNVQETWLLTYVRTVRVEYYIIQSNVDFGFLACSYSTCVRIMETLVVLKWLEP